MPEGPEIRRAADALQKQLAGRVIDSVRFGQQPLKKWEHRLIGATIKQIETHGKAMLTRLDNGLNIYSHNQLYGRWVICDADDYPDSKRQLRIAIDCQGKSAHLYSASDIAVIDDAALLQHPFLSKLGPDVLNQSTTVAHLVERLRSAKYKKRQLGGILTEQSFVAGLGNYLRCEILFYSGTHPKIRSKDLDDKKLNLLARTILDLSRQSYHTAGITNHLANARKMMSQGVAFEDARFYVFRRQGLACYRCGAIIKKSHTGQPCFYCPTCQLPA